VPEGKAGGRKATPQKCSAPQYVDYVMTWVEDQINKEEVTVIFNYLKLQKFKYLKMICCALISFGRGGCTCSAAVRAVVGAAVQMLIAV
jgi:Mob1/phocein family